MNDLLTRTFVDRLNRFQLLETALAEQEQFMFGDVPRFLKLFKKKLGNVRKTLEEALDAVVDDPLNRFLIALQTAGESWEFVRRPSGRAGEVESWEYGESPKEKLELLCVYLRVCKALAGSKEPRDIQYLKQFVPGDRLGSDLRARHLHTLRDAGLTEVVGEERRPHHVFYQLTDEGRKLTAAIFAS